MTNDKKPTEKTEDSVQILEVNSEVTFQQDRALIDQQIATARAYPRNLQKAINNCIALVTMDKETAETCTYSVPRGGKAITGPSVHLAKIIAQQFGNMRVEAKVVDVNQKQVTSQAVCFDLENNLAIKVEVKRSIWGKTGRFNDDMIMVTSNAANAIALRNAILAVVPRSVVNKVYGAAQQTIIGDVSDENKLKAARKRIVDALKNTYGVTEVEILSTVGKASVDVLTTEDLVTLTGIGTALKEGETTVDSAFRGKKETVSTQAITAEELLTMYESKKQTLSAAERKDFERIIFGKETLSFQKVHDRLKA